MTDKEKKTRFILTRRPELLAKMTKEQLIAAREHVQEMDSTALWECWATHFKPLYEHKVSSARLSKPIAIKRTSL